MRIGFRTHRLEKETKMKKNKVSKIGLMVSAAMAAVGFSAAFAGGSIVGVIAGLGIAPIVALWSAAPAIERMV